MSENFNYRDIIKLPKILARTMDAEDGKKDDKISGSIWNSHIEGTSGNLKMNENASLSFADAVSILTKYISGSSDKEFKTLCDSFNIGNIDIDSNITTYNEDGTKESVREYDNNGNLTGEKIYGSDGKIKKRNSYRYNDDGKRVKEVLTEYDEGKVSRINIKNNGIFTKSVEVFPQKKHNVVCLTDFDNGNIRKQFFAQKDGKTIRYAQYLYDKDNNLLEETVFNEDGKKLNEKKYIDGIWTEITYEKDGSIKEQKNIMPDGVINMSTQTVGNCYLLATINSILNLTNGKKYLESLIKKDGNNYTITLPGAKLAAKSLLNNEKVDKDKMYVTGVYTFTEAEIIDIMKLAGEKYSKDDGDVILLEAAFEKYRKEVYKTLTENNIEQDRYHAGLYYGEDTGNILESGYERDATYILTGTASLEYYNGTNTNIVTQADKTRYKNNVPDKNSYNMNLAIHGDFNFAGYPVDEENPDNHEVKGQMFGTHGLCRMLTLLLNDKKDNRIDYIATCTIVEEDDEWHICTIKSVSNTHVVLIDPNEPYNEWIVNMNEFLNIAKRVVISKFSPD